MYILQVFIQNIFSRTIAYNCSMEQMYVDPEKQTKIASNRCVWFIHQRLYYTYIYSHDRSQCEYNNALFIRPLQVFLHSPQHAVNNNLILNINYHHLRLMFCAVSHFGPSKMFINGHPFVKVKAAELRRRDGCAFARLLFIELPTNF